MDFLVDFSKLFLEKHGQKVYNKICSNIENEASTKYNNQYLQVVFKVALLDFWEMSDDNVSKFFKGSNNMDVNIKNIKKIHKVSIKEIQKYIKDSINNEK